MLPWTTVLKGIAAAAVLLVIGLAYEHYVSLERQVTSLTAINAQKDTALAVQKDTISQQSSAITAWKGSMEAFHRDLEAYAEVQKLAQLDRSRLDATLARHDLGKDAVAAPLLVERVVNTASARASADLMCSTGADRPDCQRAGSATTGKGGASASSAGKPAAR